jgi:5-methylcytosine-specific restriction endonuclease McrA
LRDVFVLDSNKQPLAPTHPARARILLKQGKAAVFRRYPFILILKKAVEQPVYAPLWLKLDPGSKTTGLAIVNDQSGEVVFAAHLTHRGQQIVNALAQRRVIRRSRRQRKTRYRKPRFNNRSRRSGWFPPSLESRVQNILTWVQRLRKVCPIVAISQELVKFDLQLMEDAEISGVAYQQGTLAGYEVREYLLEKWGRQCVYCGAKEVPLEVEHISPRRQSHDERMCNLTLACEACNTAKGTQDIRVFLKDQPDLLTKLLAQAKAPLRDAAAVNSTRWLLYERLNALGLPVECGSGGLTKYNRTRRDLPKAHWIDAANVGKSTSETLQVKGVVPLLITANGHGCRQMCLMSRYGFPRTKPKKEKRVKGFQTGDIVRACVTKGMKVGTYVGRVAVRATGSFNITTTQGKTVQGIGYRSCRVLHRCDGYSYGHGGSIHPDPREGTPTSSPCLKDRGIRRSEV